MKLAPMKMFNAYNVAMKLNPLLYILMPTLFKRPLLARFSNPFHRASMPLTSISSSIYSMSLRAYKKRWGNDLSSMRIRRKL